MITTRKKVFLAKLLLDKGLVTQEQINKAVELQKRSDKKIGQILIDQGIIKEEVLYKLLSEQLNIPYIHLKNYPLVQTTVVKLPEFYSRHFRAILLDESNEKYLVGMVDPQDILAKDEIENILKSKINLALIREEDLLAHLDKFYRRTEEISQYAESLSEELKPSNVIIPNDADQLESQDLPVVNLLRSIFEDAVQMHASDIHIEPGNKVLYIRLRIDGVLHEQTINEKEIINALVQRVKLISGLNIAEKRLPQDGRFSIETHGHKLDVRVSTIPTQYGESLVMRLLNQADSMLPLIQIGMPENVYEFYSKIIKSTYGLILIVGPTGSGKTTTLYSTLNMLNSSEDKIITVEDPVEYRIERINQIQVNTKIGLTFANVLRSILRQDPDIIMIGELRDQETVEISLRAALTGHLVLATLHTNNTISAISRLLDMNAEGYILASVLRTIISQRLVRKNCLNCLTDDPLNFQEMNWLESIDPELLNSQFKHSKGCSSCNNTGYKGREGVFEILPMSDELIEAIRNCNTSEVNRIARSLPLYQPLVFAAIDLAKKGITSISEVIKMAGIV